MRTLLAFAGAVAVPLAVRAMDAPTTGGGTADNGIDFAWELHLDGVKCDKHDWIFGGDAEYTEESIGRCVAESLDGTAKDRHQCSGQYVILRDDGWCGCTNFVDRGCTKQVPDARYKSYKISWSPPPMELVVPKKRCYESHNIEGCPKELKGPGSEAKCAFEVSRKLGDYAGCSEYFTYMPNECQCICGQKGDDCGERSNADGDVNLYRLLPPVPTPPPTPADEDGGYDSGSCSYTVHHSKKCGPRGNCGGSISFHKKQARVEDCYSLCDAEPRCKAVCYQVDWKKCFLMPAEYASPTQAGVGRPGKGKMRKCAVQTSCSPVPTPPPTPADEYGGYDSGSCSYTVHHRNKCGPRRNCGGSISVHKKQARVEDCYPLCDAEPRCKAVCYQVDWKKCFLMPAENADPTQAGVGRPGKGKMRKCAVQDSC